MRPYLLITLLILVTLGFAFARQSCPQNAVIKNGEYIAPFGWNITDQNLGQINNTLFFYIATYNFDHRIGINNNRISCLYKDRANQYELEITTKKANWRKPSEQIWQSLDEKSLVCLPNTPLKASECGWDD